MQRKLRRLAPMPIGCVFIQWPTMSDDDIRTHFRTMRELGFTCLKGIMPCPGTPLRKLQELAIEADLSPWWYDEAGWEDPTPELLSRLGLPPDLPPAEALAQPVMRAHQRGLMLARIAAEDAWRVDRSRASDTQGSPFLPGKQDPDAVPGVNRLTRAVQLAESEWPDFIAWLRGTYRDVESLKQAWNAYSSSHSVAAASWRTWADVANGAPHFPQREFRHLRDILRYRSDRKLERLREAIREAQARDPHAPVRAGGEISIFLPHAAAGIDLEGFAHLMAEGGCFYPSMHPGWHLEEVEFELVRPTYMQAAQCADWARGAWSAPIESSGGPQWWSGGGKVPFVPEARDLQPAFTFTGGTMMQLLCTYLAAGFKGFGLWCWNPREAGWEAGEYALCDRNNAVTERARVVGAVGQAMCRYRRELWDAAKEPQVGLLQDWENDAMWAALAVNGRERYKREPMNARIGAARALIDANVPWEHVTPWQLAQGLGPRYRAIYLPACLALSAALLADLEAYVRQGGRLVLDMPGAWLDEYGRLLDTRPGSAFERLFGVVLHEYGHGNNQPARLGELAVSGFTAVLTPTTARATRAFDDGRPAITENALGAGRAIVLGLDAALQCRAPGQTAMQALLVETAIGAWHPDFRCDDAIVYRLAAPAADHYFIINDGPERATTLETPGYQYRRLTDAITAVPLIPGMPIALAAHSARWLRFEK